MRPRIRCRSARVLTGAEREEISRGIASGQSLRLIARILNRSPSTLSREVRRNGGRTRYRAAEADKQAWKRARRRKRCRLVCRPQLCQVVEEKLREARGFQKGTDAVSAFEAHDPSIPACDPQRPRRWADPRLNLDPRASGYGGGQSGAGPLGGRSIGGIQQQPHRYAGGAALAVCDAGQGGGQGHRDR